MSAPAIGIDLGTTFSCAAFYREGKGVQIIPNEDGDYLIPSVVYFDPNDGKVLVGKHAIDAIPECQSNGIYDAKRIIGRRLDDEYVTKFLNSDEVTFEVVHTTNEQAAFKLTRCGIPIIKTPEEVSAEVLKYIRKYASAHLDCDVTEAVISVPAYFSNAQRKYTKKAAEMAGLKTLRLITEPTAAAIHYISDRERNDLTVLVYDFGGGTLDISLIKITEQKFEVKAVYGDTFLGGRNIDNKLFEHFQNKLLQNRSLSESRKKIFLRRLRSACVEVKKKLSHLNQVKYPLACSFGGDEEVFLTMTRTNFEQLMEDILSRAFQLMKVCLDDSGVLATDVDEVVLVGGSSRIPKVREMLENHFGAHKIKTSVNMDQAVAGGAALQATLLKEKLCELEKYNIKEVTPLSIGVEIIDNLMLTKIPRNSVLPFDVTWSCETMSNDQEMCTIAIFEGERKNTKYNNLLGNLCLKDLPQKRAGEVKIELTMHLDEDGILNVSAQEKSSGVKEKLTVVMGHFRLSEKKIEISVEEAKKRRVQDEIFAKFVTLRAEFIKACNCILYDIDKISPEEDRDFVAQHCYDFIRFADGLFYTEIKSLKSTFGLLNMSVSDILRKYLMYSIILKAIYP